MRLLRMLKPGAMLNLHRKILFAIVAVVLCEFALAEAGFAQTYGARFRMSYNSYQMSALRELENDIINSLHAGGVRTRKFHSFPGYIGYQVHLMRHVDSSRTALGLLFDYASTGSRIHYSDYSGEILIDQVLSRIGFGLILEVLPITLKSFNIITSLQLIAANSELTIDESIRVFDEGQENISRFEAFNIHAAPMIAAMVEYGHFNIQAEIGFETTIAKNSLGSKQRGGGVLKTQKGIPVMPQWNGIRLAIVMGFKL